MQQLADGVDGRGLGDDIGAVAEDCSGVDRLRSIRAEAAASLEIGEGERRHIVAIEPGDYDVAKIGREMRDDPGAQRPNADPGAMSIV